LLQNIYFKRTELEIRAIESEKKEKRYDEVSFGAERPAIAVRT